MGQSQGAKIATRTSQCNVSQTAKQFDVWHVLPLQVLSIIRFVPFPDITPKAYKRLMEVRVCDVGQLFFYQACPPHRLPTELDQP